MKIETSPATKKTVTITRRELWENFIVRWGRLSYESDLAIYHVRNVNEVLCTGKPLKHESIKQLFTDYCKYLLSDEILNAINLPRENNVFGEILVQDDVPGANKELFLISNSDLKF